MKKLLVFVAIVLALLVSFLFVAQSKYNTNVPFVVKELVRTSENTIAKSYPQGETLNESGFNVPSGLRLALFANLDDYGAPRALAFDEKGTLFVTLTKKGEVLAIPDADGNGIADRIKVVLSGLQKPHGIAFHGGQMFVAEEDKVVLYNYDFRELIASPVKTILQLPEGGRHFTRTIKVHGDKVYVSVGSSCDVCIEENGYRAAIIETDFDGRDPHVFAYGLRNTVFFDFDKEGNLWGSDMGRDFLGDTLPPDELNLITEGGNYGWPFCYGDKILDVKFSSSYNCSDTKSAAVEYPAHSAPLGTTFISSPLLPDSDQGHLLVAFHGSWNSTVPVGYKIVKVNQETGTIDDFISGWLTTDGKVLGRPVDLAFDKNGVLYISDDKANVIYILTRENSHE